MISRELRIQFYAHRYRRYLLVARTPIYAAPQLDDANACVGASP